MMQRIVAFHNLANEPKIYFQDVLLFLIMEVQLGVNPTYSTKHCAENITIWKCVRDLWVWNCISLPAIS